MRLLKNSNHKIRIQRLKNEIMKIQIIKYELNDVKTKLEYKRRLFNVYRWRGKKRLHINVFPPISCRRHPDPDTSTYLVSCLLSFFVEFHHMLYYIIKTSTGIPNIYLLHVYNRLFRFVLVKNSSCHF